MNIIGKGDLKSSELKMKSEGAIYVYTLQINGKITTNPPQLIGEGIVDKDLDNG